VSGFSLQRVWGDSGSENPEYQVVIKLVKSNGMLKTKLSRDNKGISDVPAIITTVPHACAVMVNFHLSISVKKHNSNF
jgi:hypothetical protein